MVCTACPAPRWHRRFLKLLPAIVTHARYAFRHLKGDAKQDAIQEVIANALVAFVRLDRRGKADRAFGTTLAKYAVAQFGDGRRVGNTMNCHEVLSPYAQRLKGIHVGRLDHFDAEENQWQEAVVEDTRTAPVLDTVAFRVDFADWLKSLKRRDRRVAEYLSLGNRTTDAARKFGVCQGRISQLRRELAQSWNDFTDGSEANAA